MESTSGKAVAKPAKGTKRTRVTFQVAESTGKVPPFVTYLPIDDWHNPQHDPRHDKAQYELFDRGTGDRPDYALVGRLEADGDHPTGVSYIASSDNVPDHCGEQPNTLAVGIYNTKLHTLTMMPIAGNQVYRLETRLDNQIYQAQAQAGHELARGEAATKVGMLSEAFGSTRIVRRRQANSDARVTGLSKAAGAGKAVPVARGDHTTDIIDQQRASSQFANVSRVKLEALTQAARRIPPHRVGATTPHDAYPLDGLAPLRAWEGLDLTRLLKASKDTALAKRMLDEELLPAYVIDRLPMLLNKGESVAKRKAHELEILAALMYLYVAPNSVKGTLPQLSDKLFLDQQLVKPLLDAFYTRQDSGNKSHTLEYERDKGQKEDLGVRLITVALLLDDGCLPPRQYDALIKALKVPATEMMLWCRELGCVLKVGRFEVPRGAGMKAELVNSFTASLLIGTGKDKDKTLQQCLPVQRIGKAPPKRK